MDELTTMQWKNFLATHPNVCVKHDGTDYAPWITYQEGPRYCELRKAGNSIAESVTNYASEHDPDWTPPAEDAEPRSIIHDAEWALRYVDEHELEVIRCKTPGLLWEWTVDRVGLPGMRAVGGTLMESVLNWIAKYDPDKPTREETVVDTELRSAMQYLKILREHFFAPGISADFLDEVDSFIETAESADERSKGSEPTENRPEEKGGER